jgi:hypothetical protein
MIGQSLRMSSQEKNPWEVDSAILPRRGSFLASRPLPKACKTWHWRVLGDLRQKLLRCILLTFSSPACPLGKPLGKNPCFLAVSLQKNLAAYQVQFKGNSKNIFEAIFSEIISSAFDL